MKAQLMVVGVCFLVCVLPTEALGQAGGVALSGPSPWIDPTAPIYGAKCNGAADDTLAIQSALNALAPNGGTLFIPPTANGCLVNGYWYTTTSSVYITGVSVASKNTCGNGTCEATVTFSSAPTNLERYQNQLVNIHSLGDGAGGTIFNGTYVIAVYGLTNSNGDCASPGTTGNPPCIGYTVGGSAADSASSITNAVAEIGLYYNGNNLKIEGASAAPGSSGSSTVSLLKTSSAITILTTMTNSTPHMGPDIQNLAFYDSSGSSGGNPFGALRIGNTNGFNISNDGFYGFFGTATVTTNFQAGAAIVLTGGQPTSAMPNPWVQFGKVENNHFSAKIGVTTEFNVSSVTFDSNSIGCLSQDSYSYPTNGTIGLDLGGLWYLNNGPAVAGNLEGESRVINQQSQNCVVGVLLGSQNNDVVEEKLENGAPGPPPMVQQCAAPGTSPPYCPIGLAILNTDDSTLFAQSKKVATGIYIDAGSPNNRIYENTTGNTTASDGISSGATLNSLCPNSACASRVPTYSFNSGSLVIDPSAPSVAAGTTIFGTPSGGGFAPNSYSTFTTDNEPSGLNVSMQGANVALTVTGDSHSSDILDAYENGSNTPLFSVSPLASPTVGNAGYVTGYTLESGGSDYSVGDVVLVNPNGSPTGGAGATFLVTSVSGGAVQTNGLSLLKAGTGYSPVSGTGTTDLTNSGAMGLTITPAVGYTIGGMVFKNGTNLFTSTLQAPANPSASATLTLPPASGRVPLAGFNSTPAGSQCLQSSGTLGLIAETGAGCNSGTVTSIATSSPITGGTITGTGTIGCLTCATTTNGGALSGTSPVAISAGGDISITGQPGEVLAGSPPTFTATPILGVPGTILGSVTLAGSSSGSSTIQPAGATGGTFTLPTVNATGPTAQPTATNQPLVANTSGIQSYSPTVQATTLEDANGNTYLNVSPTSSAVDYFNITNAATGSPTVAVGATGSDSNVNLDLITKGTGVVEFNGGALPVGSGGTGIASGNSGGVLGFTASGMLASSSALAANALVVGGGPGATPSTGNSDFTYQTHTLTAGGSAILDLHSASPSTGLLIPEGASGLPTADGQIAFNTSTHHTVAGYNGTATWDLTPMTAAGDIVYGGNSGAPTRLAVGSNGTTLSVSSGDPAWIGPLTEYQIGTNQGSQAAFDGGTANQVNYATITIPVAVSLSYLTVNVTTADSANNYAWGLYNSSGTALCTVSNTTLPSTGPVKKSCSQTTPVLITPGNYVVATWGSASTAKYAVVGSAGAISLLTTSTQANQSSLPSSLSSLNSGLTTSTVGGINLVLQ